VGTVASLRLPSAFRRVSSGLHTADKRRPWHVVRTRCKVHTQLANVALHAVIGARVTLGG
jgi:hypothetical protein